MEARGAYSQRHKLNVFCVKNQNDVVVAAVLFDVHTDGNVEILFATTDVWSRGMSLMRLLATACADLSRRAGGTSIYVISSVKTIDFWVRSTRLLFPSVSSQVPTPAPLS